MKKKTHKTTELDYGFVIDNHTPFEVIEAYRSLYSNILFMPFRSRCKKFVITSAYSGEGKTTVSINLAYTIAAMQPEAKVLLVDCDMSAPSIDKYISDNGTDFHGLSEYLASIDDIPYVQQTKYDNLSFLSSGATNTNAPALLSSSRMTKLVEYFEDNYDYVIIDTPPVNVMSDAVFLGEHCDGYILVTRAGYSDIGGVNELIKKLHSFNAKILGIVLCGADEQKNTKHGRYGAYLR